MRISNHICVVVAERGIHGGGANELLEQIVHRDLGFSTSNISTLPTTRLDLAIFDVCSVVDNQNQRRK